MCWKRVSVVDIPEGQRVVTLTRASILLASLGAQLRAGLLGLMLWAAAGAGATVAAEPTWTAQWIAPAEADLQAAGVYHFRRSFDLATTPARFVIHVSADMRYRLYVNGEEVSAGPARSDVAHWRYETIDLAPHLRPGRNVLAAVVWNWGALRPLAQMSHRTAFLVQGEGLAADLVDTGPSWRALTNPAYGFRPVVPPDSGDFYAAAPGEKIDARLYPWGWERVGFDDSGWTAAVPSVGLPGEGAGAAAAGTSAFGWASDWQLEPRRLPMPEARPQRFAQLRRAEGVAADDRFLHGTGDLVIPAHTRVTLLLDQGELTLGYPVLRTSGGSGARAILTYAESLFDAQGRKGNRDEIAGKTIRGLRDEIGFDGGRDRVFQTLWLRSWRYVQMDITTADEPLHLVDMRSQFTAYPFEQKATFSSEPAWLAKVWQLNWRSLRLSAFETFWDTPYYEQLQYAGDARIAALLAVYQTGDGRLLRNAIEQFDASRNADGLTASAYPSAVRQQIPGFSLQWIAMVHDYWMINPDPSLVRRMLPGIRATIAWHEWHVGPTGLVGPLPWWPFLDWAEGWERGVPPGGRAGESIALTLHLAHVARLAAELEQGLGRTDEAGRNSALADRLITAARVQGWDPARGLFVDSPGRDQASQQTNALAVLAGALPAAKARELMARVLVDRSLTQASLYFRFHLDQALFRTGLGGSYLARLGPWRDMVARGMTSTAETVDPTRSDSHVWSAHPNYFLLAGVAGIQPAAPGFAEVRIAPDLGDLRGAIMSMPHPAGTIAAAFRRRGAEGLTATIALPDATRGHFVWRGAEITLPPGRSTVHCAPPRPSPRRAVRPVSDVVRAIPIPDSGSVVCLVKSD